MHKDGISRRNRVLLCAMNFFLSDVRDNLVPFLAIYLMVVQHWNQQQIGIVLTVMSLATVALQTPAGAIMDSVRAKRTVFSLAALCAGISAVILIFYPTFWFVTVSKIFSGATVAFIPPAIASITLGITGRKHYTHQVGYNEVFRHTGSVVTAALSGAIGYYYNAGAVFYIVLVSSLLSILVASQIRSKDIDYEKARGLEPDETDHSGVHHRPSRLRVIFENRDFVIFTLAITLFHLANAALLSTVGEKLSVGHDRSSMLYMATAIVVAQFFMVGMAGIVGWKADVWGRKKLFLVAFVMLAARAGLFASTDNPYLLVSGEALDGIANGIFAPLLLIIIADLTKGTGHYNLALGIATTIMGIGISVSMTLGGSLVVYYGYTAAFLSLGAIGLLGLLVFLLFMPETLHYHLRPKRS